MEAEPWVIVQTVAGVYCAIITTVAYVFPRHAQQQTESRKRLNMRSDGIGVAWLLGVVALILSLTAPSILRLFGTTWGAVAIASVVLAVVALVVLTRIGISIPEPKLKIISARYGLGNANDADLTTVLAERIREGFVFWVDNGLLPPSRPDPAANRVKKLKVTYKFGAEESVTLERSEHSLMVLPVDPFLIDENQKLKNMLVEIKSERDEVVKGEQKENERLRGVIQAQVDHANNQALRIAELEKSKAESAVHITSASWGNANKRERNFATVIKQMPSEGIAFHLSPDTFRNFTTEEIADPARGPGKYIEITYQSGPHSGTLTRSENDWVILPEDPILLKQRDDALAQYDDEQQDHKETRLKLRDSETARQSITTELATTKHYLENVQQQAEARANELKSVQQDLDALKRQGSIPQLLMQFKEADRHDTFVLSNEGPDSIQQITIGDLKLKQFNPLNPGEAIQQTITITPFDGIGILRKGDAATVKFGAKRDSAQQGLTVFIRDLFSAYHMFESDHAITVTYESMDEDSPGRSHWRLMFTGL